MIDTCVQEILVKLVALDSRCPLIPKVFGHRGLSAAHRIIFFTGFCGCTDLMPHVWCWSCFNSMQVHAKASAVLEARALAGPRRPGSAGSDAWEAARTAVLSGVDSQLTSEVNILWDT